MADQAKVGTIWQDDDLDAIVADYFAMLEADLNGRPYVKARHSAALMAKIGRTHRSVEFKHQNISAVLDELGLPWIPGYIPKRNYQNAIFGAIDRYLTRHPEALERLPKPHSTMDSDREVFVPPPQKHPEPCLPAPLLHLIRKFDPVDRDHRNRALGKAGEGFVLDIERRGLTQQGRSDLAAKVRWVAAEDGDGAGYDVLSFRPNGDQRLIEVKTTHGSARTPFFLTNTELAVSVQLPGWCIYRVHDFARAPRIFTLLPPLGQAVHLAPENWKASFR